MTDAIAERPGLRLAGVHDGSSPAWRAFYPEGLPEDWRLAYYGHFWNELLFPVEEWAGISRDTRWASDLPETFRVYFELPESPGAAGARLAAQLADHVGGFLLQESPARIPDWMAPERAYPRRADPALEGARTSRCFARDRQAILLLDPEPGLTLPGWRRLLESLREDCAEESLLVFLRCGPRELENAETIRQLAGLV